jgi:amino acid transporter
MPAYVMFGFDTAGSLAEETNDPRRRGPRAILMALGAAGVAGMLLLLFALMSAKDLHNPALSSNGLPYLVKSVLGTTLGDILLWDVVLSIGVCCLAIHTAAIRMMFSMARDNALPGSTYIAKVSEKSRTPVVPAVIVGVLAMLILLVNINQPKIFTVITGIAIVMIYLAYLCVTVPLLQRRSSGWQGVARAQGLFSMGPAGIIVNAFAVAYGAFMAINIGWPRNEIYGAGNYMWGGLIFIVGVIAIGGIWYAAVGRERIGVLASHRVLESEPQLAEQAFGGP